MSRTRLPRWLRPANKVIITLQHTQPSEREAS